MKMDDAGLKLSQVGSTDTIRNFGRGIVKFMPTLLKIISVIGTAAMLWVGGNIIVHGLEVLGWHWPYDTIKGIAKSIGGESGVIKWVVTAGLDGVLGLALGLVLIPIVTKGIVPFLGLFFPEKQKASH